MRSLYKNAQSPASPRSDPGNTSRSAVGSQPLEQEEGRSAFWQKVLILVAVTVWGGRNRQRQLDLRLWRTTNKVRWRHMAWRFPCLLGCVREAAYFFYSYAAHPLHRRRPLWVAPANESKDRNVKTHPDDNFQLKMTELPGKFQW